VDQRGWIKSSEKQNLPFCFFQSKIRDINEISIAIFLLDWFNVIF